MEKGSTTVMVALGMLVASNVVQAESGQRSFIPKENGRTSAEVFRAIEEAGKQDALAANFRGMRMGYPELKNFILQNGVIQDCEEIFPDGVDTQAYTSKGLPDPKEKFHRDCYTKGGESAETIITWTHEGVKYALSGNCGNEIFFPPKPETPKPEKLIYFGYNPIPEAPKCNVGSIQNNFVPNPSIGFNFSFAGGGWQT